jgi:uncharacterized protein YbjQ (UPF0145 family)
MLVTTTPGIEGRPVTEYLGVVTAQGVLGVNAFKDVGAGMRNIFGGRAKSYENELASGVSDALAEMEQQAAQLGADAVVGVDIDYETVGNNMLMVSASGTAVKLGWEPPGRDPARGPVWAQALRQGAGTLPARERRSEPALACPYAVPGVRVAEAAGPVQALAEPPEQGPEPRRG